MDRGTLLEHCTKLKKVLDAIIQPDYEPRSDTCFNVLLSHISGKMSPETSNVLRFEMIWTWLNDALKFWQKDPNIEPSQDVIAFVLELIGILSFNVPDTLYWNKVKIYEKLCDRFCITSKDTTLKVKVAYVKMLKAFLNHNQGIISIIRSEAWKNVWTFCLSKTNTYHLWNESSDFLYKLMVSRITGNVEQSLCNEIVTHLMEPLLLRIEKIKEKKKDNATIEEKKLDPSFRMFSNILEKYLKNQWATKFDIHVPHTILKKNELVTHLNTYYHLMTILSGPGFEEVLHLLLRAHFVEMCAFSEKFLITKAERSKYETAIFDLLDKTIVKDQPIIMTLLCFMTMKYWHMMHSRFEGEICEDEEDLEDWVIFQIQIVVMQLVPVFLFLEEEYYLEWALQNPEIDSPQFALESFVPQMSSVTIQMGNRYKKDVTYYRIPGEKALQHIELTIPYYDRKTAVVLFQGLVYTFHICNKSTLRHKHVPSTEASNDSKFYSTLCIVLNQLIEKFNFGWADCPQNVSVLTVSTLEALHGYVPDRTIVERLKLQQLALKHNLSWKFTQHKYFDMPYDGWLVGTGIILSGHLLYDANWAIKDTTIEIISTITDLIQQHPFLKKIIMAGSLMSNLYISADEDPEPYVRASALKCLQKMIQIPDLWTEPIREYWTMTATNIQTNEEQLKQHITPTLRLVASIFDQYLKKESIQRNHQHIVTIFVKTYDIGQLIDTFLASATDEDFVFDLANLTYATEFVRVCVEAKEHTFAEEEITPLVKKLFTLLSDSITKQYCSNVLRLSHVAVRYWHLIRPRLMLVAPPNAHRDINKEPLIFENQLVILHSMPSFIFVVFRFNLPLHQLMHDDFRDNFANKVLRQMCEYTIRLFYNYRQALVETPNGYELGKKALDYIMETRAYYDRDQAVIIFQTLVYLLKDIVTFTKDDAGLIEIAKTEAEFINSVLILIGQFIDAFRITWRDCVESICIVGLTLHFLSITAWPKKLMLEAFKLLQFAIEKYMSPNLALLVDRTQDSSLDMLCPLLAEKMQDDDWEIREGGLRVLSTVCEFSYSKFPSFQGVLLELGFAPLLIKIITNDPEPAVRAASLKCLQEMVQNHTLWSKCLEENDALPQKITHILNNEPDATVRTEAAALIQLLYKHQSLADDNKPQIYEMMAFSTTLDLHGEVRRKGLHFWQEVIGELLRNQGMIDGCFPNVTFSREHRKIVTLTEIEIKRRLNKVLLQLGEIGCLGVLMSALQDDCDLEVTKEAVTITKRFIALVNQYNVNFNDKCRSPSISSTDSEFVPQFKCARSVSNASFNSQSTGSSIRIVTPCYFLEFVRQQDLDQLIERRKNWQSGNDSFMFFIEEMLKDCDQIDRMDCY